MTYVMSHGFHACDSFENMSCFISFDWLKGGCSVGSREWADGIHTMTQYQSQRLHEAR